ncbi:MAG: hypothetical protein QXH85_04820 [Candidatus Bathyarchaeia archaeon]
MFRRGMLKVMAVRDLEKSGDGEVLGWALPGIEEVLTLPVEELFYV